MYDRTIGELGIIANQNIKERNYWLNRLSGQVVKSAFPGDYQKTGKAGKTMDRVEFRFPDPLFSTLLKLGGGSDPRLHMVLVAAMAVLVYKFTYTGNKDIILGAPVYKQAVEGAFINTVLPLRLCLENDPTFKQLLLQTRRVISEADEHQDYPMNFLWERLNIEPLTDEFPLFDIAVLVKNIHDKRYIAHTGCNTIFSFHRGDTALEGEVEYNAGLYKKTTIERIIRHLEYLLENAVSDVDVSLSCLDTIPPGEKAVLLSCFNGTETPYPGDQTLHRLFVRQAGQTPDRTAVTGMAPGDSRGWLTHLTYRELNRASAGLAAVLRKRGAGPGTIVGVMAERSPHLVTVLLAILKTGAAYLPIDPGTPGKRVLYMLKDAGAGILLTYNRFTREIPFSALQNFEADPVPIVTTAGRPHIEAFNNLPRPDRSLINLEKYKNKIGMASVTNCIAIQSTRGCPFKCLYCHKIWSKHYVYRNAENIFNEIEYYYRRGVRNFAFIDDCFNLDMENSSRLFQLIVKSGIKIRLFFPNGLRGDIMTGPYIDLMVEAGTRGINLSLETASPRLQKLLKKNLDLDKFRNVVHYIAGQHPGILLEMATMHGFPSETEEEAMMTLDFIKSIQWLHFPYIHILKIFPNTEMEAFALEQGISKKDIIVSKNRAFHELPETLPFAKSFTRRYQSIFMNEYFLSQQRLEQVLPNQLKILSREAIIQKYNAYLPVEIKSIGDIIRFTGLEDRGISVEGMDETVNTDTIFHWPAPVRPAVPNAHKILLLDLSQHFSSHSMLYKVTEQPLGLVYLGTYLKERFGDQIDVRIYKAGSDFDSFAELRHLVSGYNPGLIGIRTLTFFKEFFHQTVSLIRQWGITAPVITGGPYASSDYDTILQDKHVNLVVLGEGEYTLGQLLEIMLADGFKFPGIEVLQTIKGIAFAAVPKSGDTAREVLLLDEIGDYPDSGTETGTAANSPAYVMYTSGSTGKPKGVMVEHRQVNNCIAWMQDRFRLTAGDTVVQRTNLSFDPSVWEIFWPLHTGAGTRIIDGLSSIDAEYLLGLMADNVYKKNLTVMYCPATLVSAMAYLLESGAGRQEKKLYLPWLITGAEPITREVANNFYRYFTGRLVNTYGPTECTINNTYVELEPGDRENTVPIGWPVANNKIYIMSRDLQVLPLSVPGEICIAGAGVSRGYVNNIDRTRECFIPNPFAGGILYRTGDLGRWREPGGLEILGRLDGQIKIRGYRIEPGEIEKALAAHPAVRQCLVVAKNNENRQDKVTTCKKCAITSRYPGIKINEESICNRCDHFHRYRKTLDSYFKTPDDLERLLKDLNRDKKGTYDCLLTYNGGRGSGYALYRLVEMGFKVLTLSYDNGYLGKAHLENIKKITAKLGVGNVVLKHKNTDHILAESVKKVHTVCRGCFHAFAAMAGEYALKNNINAVIGATLSRGQIIDNKLMMPMEQGITQIEALEKEIARMQMAAPEIDKEIFDYIDIDAANDGSLYKKVKFLDFFRYCDITNKEMIAYLDNKDPYWKTRKYYAIYSTNCPLKQIGDFGHLENTGYHYYGAAESWELRLGHITRENLLEDIACGVPRGGYEKFLKRIGLQASSGRELEKSDHNLCAYVVLRDQPGVKPEMSALREYLSGELPGYMIPAYFMPVEKIPLTPNGKVDMERLPEPRLSAGGDYTTPQNSTEEKLVNIWSGELGIEKSQLSVTANFFDLGGNSLKAIRLTAEIHKELNVKVPLAEVFRALTIRGLAEYIGGEDENTFAAVKNSEEKEFYVLSSGQKRLYFQQQINTGNTGYNMPEIVVLEGPLDREKLTDTFRHLIQRHESLRTSFRLIGDEPVQVIHDRVEFAMKFNRLSLPGFSQEAGPGVREEMEGILKNFVKPFCLTSAPLIRVELLYLLPPGHAAPGTGHGEKHLLLIDMHHIISDGTSTGILVKELMKRYMNLPLPDIKIRCRDYCQWQEELFASGRLKAREDYWLGIFKEDIPVLDFPTDYARPKQQTFAGDRYFFRIDNELSRGIELTAQETETTLFIFLLAVYYILAARYSRQEDIVVGTPVSGRPHADLQDIIGLFVNLLPIRNRVVPGKTFREFLEIVKTSALEAFENQDYQLDQLLAKLELKRRPGRNPLFDTIFGLQNQDRGENELHYLQESTGLKIKHYNTPFKRATRDLILLASRNRDRLDFSLEYATTLFKAETAEKIAGNYLEILNQVVDNPGIKLNEVTVSHGLLLADSGDLESDGGDFQF